jgi:mannose-6-phosphate isomerase-like protein (cupin superfamily)
MSLLDADGHRAVLVRATEAEVLAGGPTTIRLLADADTTDGAISANRTRLEQGADGPPPHYHQRSAEIFFVIGGSLQALAGDRVLALDEGDFLVVPRGMPHAFAAAQGAHADVLIVFAPGLDDRFEYFRLANRVISGQASPREILDTQERFDNHFIDSPTWRRARAELGGRAGGVFGPG